MPVDRAPHPGHQLQLLKGGEALFPALVEAIDAARLEVRLETYIFHFERSVLPVAGALERAAARGVVVNVVVDGMGTDEVPAEWQQRWAAAGVHWRIFNPAQGWRVLIPKRWRRMHRKLCVVDASVAFCGGINLLDDHYDPNYGALEEPRFDFAVCVRGPLVADMLDTMARLWARLQVTHEAQKLDFAGAVEAVRAVAHAGTELGDADLPLPRQSFEPRPADSGSGTEADGLADTVVRNATAALVLRDNLRYRRSIEDTYRLAIGRAQREILIANAYFIPGVQLQRSLLHAARRGVKITLLLQGRYEYFMAFHAGRAVYGPLLDAGVEIIEYEASFLHAKVAVMDSESGAVATVGSSNLDPLSLLLAREANVFVRDDAFAAELRGHLVEAIATQGRRVDPAAHHRRGYMPRVMSWGAYAAMRLAVFLTGQHY